MITLWCKIMANDVLILTDLDCMECKMSNMIKRFTASQKFVLLMLDGRDVADYYAVMRAGGNASTMKKLVAAKLVSLCETSKSYKLWKITTAWRFAIENDFDRGFIVKSAYLRFLDNLNAGAEFPDAIYRIAEKYAVDAVELKKMYDEDFLAVNRAK